jgi:acetyl-CoA acyltransferase 1
MIYHQGMGSVEPFHEDILQNQEAADCLQPMGQTSENVGHDFNITREEMDRFANESFTRAEVAQKAGWFDDEIVPITTKVKDPKSGEVKEVTLTKDEGPRYGTTMESLAKVRPAFPQFGDRTTGGNASQVTDGGNHLHPSNVANDISASAILCWWIY